MRLLALVFAMGFAGPAVADRPSKPPKRVAYLIVGHGEVNDPGSMPSTLKTKPPERRTTKLVQRLADFNYRVESLGTVDLVKDVPADADVVLLLAPTVALVPAEWAALGRYLDRDGKLLVALDPHANPSLGSLGARLGVKARPGRLVDDTAYLPQRGTSADRRLVITTQFSAHPSTSTLSRTTDKGLIVIDGNALDLVPFGKQPSPTQTVTLRSMDSSWLDLNDNLTFDAKSEAKQRWPLAVAIEMTKSGTKPGFRAIVFGDADLFVDAMTMNAGRQSVILMSGPLLDDSLRWLAGDPVLVPVEDTPPKR